MNPLEAFSSLPEPRSAHTRLYPLTTIIFLTISAVVSGADTWVEIEEFGKDKIDWLKKYVACPDNRIPSHDTLGDFFKRLDTESFATCFINWMSQVCGILSGDLIAIDGKRIRGSYDHFDNKSAIHMVSAWSSANEVVLGQVKVDEKSNEIRAIPTLLAVLELKGAIVSIDAMGCQKEIAGQIREAGADYILALKGNQSTLKEQVEAHFGYTQIASQYSETEKNHGRIEQRNCEVINNLALLDEACNWKGLQSVIRIKASRTEVITGKASTEERYYISSRITDAQTFNQYIREHWGIENKLHWLLDVQFGEDDSRIRKENSHENMSTIRRIALNLIKLDDTPKLSINSKRQKAMRNDTFRCKILNI
jgi:predicted transposase YbfD/YdcC